MCNGIKIDGASKSEATLQSTIFFVRSSDGSTGWSHYEVKTRVMFSPNVRRVQEPACQLQRTCAVASSRDFIKIFE